MEPVADMNRSRDSLYFTVGMITGAGGNEKIAEQAPGSTDILTPWR